MWNPTHPRNKRVNERPWTLKKKPSWLERRISPLKEISGVVGISDYLLDWVASEDNIIENN